MFDLVIGNGLIVDGSGGDAYTADIGVVDGRIAHIGRISSGECVSRIDADGKYVTPGFIDSHSHGDGTILLYPTADSSIMQGITTFVGGTCGDSPAPQHPSYYMRHFWEYDVWPQIDGRMYYPEFVQPRENALRVLEENYPIRFDWLTFGEYLDKVERNGSSINFIPLLGHSTIRSYAMGRAKPWAPPTEDEFAVMKSLVEEAMEAGAWGISTGLDYIPSAYATTQEIIEVARAMKKWDGIYSTHWRRSGIRREGATQSDKSMGLVEACEIGASTGLRVQISHLTSVYDISPQPSGGLKRAAAAATLGIIDSAEQDGVRVAFDVLTNTTGGFECIPYLVMYLAPWVRQSGSLSQFVSNLRCEDYRDDLKSTLESGKWFKLNRKANPSWEHDVIVSNSSNAGYIGKSVHEINAGRGGSVLDTVLGLILEDPRIMVYKNYGWGEYINAFMRHRLAMPCIDSYLYDAAGHFGTVRGWSAEIPEILPNPNAYCGFVKYLLEYEPHRFEEKVKKMTGWPAEWMGIKKRGLIKEGYHADLVVISREDLRTRENHIKPNTFPSGIRNVIVNGEEVVRDGVHLGTRPGKVLRMNEG
jgi:N-acyl-D-aspartate/D-glutamate deacylase